jgi:hypothetical protein
VKGSGAVNSMRGAMSARLTGVFQKTQQEQARRLLIVSAPSKGPSWTWRNDYNRTFVYTNGPFGSICNQMIPTGQGGPTFVEHGFGSNNDPDSPKCIPIKLPANNKWMAEYRRDSDKDDKEKDDDTVNIGIK